MKHLLQVTLIFISLTSVLLKDVPKPRVKMSVINRVTGCKRKSRNGDIIFFHYTGSLDDGKVFDSSYSSNQPYRLILGSNQVIKGWDEGLQKMCVGEKRRLVIPPELGFGEKGSGFLIPPNSILHFEVELVKIQDRTEL